MLVVTEQGLWVELGDKELTLLVFCRAGTCVRARRKRVNSSGVLQGEGWPSSWVTKWTCCTTPSTPINRMGFGSTRSHQ